MQKLKQLLKHLIFPHNAVIAILVPVATALLIYAFCAKGVSPAVQYVSYFLSAYTLAIVCAKAPALVQKIKELKQNNKHIVKYSQDAQLRIKISLLGAVATNIAYALLQLGLGIHNHSVWYYALAGYYALLGIMRLSLLKETVKNRLVENIFRELLHYRFCGILLLFMNITLGSITTYIVWQNKGFEHHYIVTIAMAAYTFTAIIVAIVNVFKYRKYNSPIMSATKAISLVSASVSLLSLETAMLSAFGDGDHKFRQIITAVTGSAVCIGVLGVAIFMIVKSTKQIKSTKNRQ